MEINRTKAFMLNSLTTAGYQLVVMLSGFIVPRILLKHYGSEINGLVSSIAQFISYFSLVEAGIAGAAVFALYKPLAQNDMPTINNVLSSAKQFYAKSGSVYLLLLLAFALIFPLFVHVGALSGRAMAVLILALGGKWVLDFFCGGKYNVILTADQKLYAVSIASSVCVALQTFIIVVLALRGVSIVLVYLLSLIAFVTRNLILWLFVKWKYPQVTFQGEVSSGCLDKRWDAFFLQILGVVQVGAPVVIATIFLSLKEVSVYAVFNMVFVGLSGILGIFISGLSASFGDVIARKDEPLLQSAYGDFEFAYYVLIGLVFAVTMILVMPFIRIYTAGIHDVNYDVPVLGVLFVANGFLYNLKTPQGMMVISAGLYRETRWRSLIQALIIVVLGCLLALLYGLVGILVASIVSNLYRDIDLAVYIPRHVTHTPVSVSVIRMIKCVLLFFVIFLPSLLFTLEPRSLPSWCACALFVCVYAALITLAFLFLFERKNLRRILQRFRQCRVASR